MSTRSAVGYRYLGKDFLEYHHSDSYPTGLGLDLFEGYRSQTELSLREFAARLHLVEGVDKPTVADINRLHASLGGLGSVPDVLDLLPTGDGTWDTVVQRFVGEPLARLTEGNAVIVDGADFIFSRSCEWAYVLDLDTFTFEIYTQHYRQARDKARGSYETPAKKDKRLALREAVLREAGQLDENDRAPCLVAKVSLQELQALPGYAISQFCERVNRIY